jgi:hypothetical protein
VNDDLLVIETSWPGTTIDGDPGIVSGMLSVSRAAGGEFLFNLPVGPAGERRRPLPTSSSRYHPMTLVLSATSCVEGFPRPMRLELSR